MLQSTLDKKQGQPPEDSGKQIAAGSLGKKTRTKHNWTGGGFTPFCSLSSIPWPGPKAAWNPEVGVTMERLGSKRNYLAQTWAVRQELRVVVMAAMGPTGI